MGISNILKVPRNRSIFAEFQPVTRLFTNKPPTTNRKSDTMKSYIATFGMLALAASISYGEDAPATPEKHKAPDPEMIFKKLDTTADGSLSLDEFKASPRGRKDPEKAEQAFKKMDKDSSGGVSFEEFKIGFHRPEGKGGHGGKGGKKPADDAPAAQ